jgi:hypothetical protein
VPPAFAPNPTCTPASQAIVHQPLILAGHRDEAQRDALLAAIRHDVSDRAGDLALVQMALYETWRESNGGRENLVEAYSRIGGVAGALAHAAEEVRTEKLSKDEAGLLEAVLVRLVTLGETGGATRRDARRSEFDPARFRLAEKLTTEHYGRLLLAGGDTFEICHEQLITQWPWWQNWPQHGGFGCARARPVDPEGGELVRWPQGKTFFGDGSGVESLQADRQTTAVVAVQYGG